MSRRVLSIILALSMICTFLQVSIVSAEDVNNVAPGDLTTTALSADQDYWSFFAEDAQVTFDYWYPSEQQSVNSSVALAASPGGVTVGGATVGFPHAMNSDNGQNVKILNSMQGSDKDSEGKPLPVGLDRNNKFVYYIFEAPADGDYWFSFNMIDTVAAKTLRPFTAYIDDRKIIDTSVDPASVFPFLYTTANSNAETSWRYQWTLPVEMKDIKAGEHVIKIQPVGENPGSDSMRLGGMVISKSELDLNNYVQQEDGTIEVLGRKYVENTGYPTYQELSNNKVPGYAKEADIDLLCTPSLLTIDLVMTPKETSGMVKEYAIFVDDEQVARIPSASKEAKTYQLTNLAPNTSYSIRVEALDYVANATTGISFASTQGRSVAAETVTTLSAVDDNEKPVFNGPISIKDVSYTSAVLEFAKATDSSGILKYEIFYKISGSEDEYTKAAEIDGLSVSADTITKEVSAFPIGKTLDIKVTAVDNAPAANTAEIVSLAAFTTKAVAQGDTPAPEKVKNGQSQATNATAADVPAGTHIVLHNNKSASNNFTSIIGNNKDTKAAARNVFIDAEYESTPNSTSATEDLLFVGKIAVPDNGTEGTYFQLMAPVAKTGTNDYPVWGTGACRSYAVKIDGKYVDINGNYVNTVEEAAALGSLRSGQDLINMGFTQAYPSTNGGTQVFWDWGPVVKIAPGVHDIEVQVSRGSGAFFHTLLLTSAIGYDWTKLVALGASLGIPTPFRTDYSNTLGATSDDFEAPVFTDTQASVSNETAYGADLTWSEATDNRGVAGYQVVCKNTVDQDDVRTFFFSQNRGRLNLAAEQTYDIEISAWDLVGHSANDVITTQVTTTIDVTVPEFNGTVTVIPFDTFATVTWPEATDDSGIQKYIVEVKKASDADYTTSVIKTETTDTKVKLTGLAVGESYQIRVSAVPNAGPGSDLDALLSLESAVFATAELPFPWFDEEAVITNVGFGDSATPAQLENQLNLKWNAANYSISGSKALYKVTVTAQGASSPTVTETGLAQANCVITGLSPLTTYDVQVETYASDDQHPFDPSAGVGNVLNATYATLDASAPVFAGAAPSLKAENDPNIYGKVNLSWPAASDVSGIKEYQVYYKLSNEEEWNQGTIENPATDLQTSISGLNRKAAYDFKVVAIANGGSPDTTELVSQITTLPYRFAYFAGSAEMEKSGKSDTTVTVTWPKAIAEDPSAVVLYKIELDGVEQPTPTANTHFTFTPNSFGVPVAVKVTVFVQGLNETLPTDLNYELTGSFATEDITPPVFENPVAPEVLEATIYETGASMRWNEAKDMQSDVHYDIYVNGKLFTSTDKNAITLTGLISDFYQTVLVVAVDAAGNRTSLPVANFKTKADEGQIEGSFVDKMIPITPKRLAGQEPGEGIEDKTSDVRSITVADTGYVAGNNGLTGIFDNGYIWQPVNGEKAPQFQVVVPSDGEYYVMARALSYNWQDNRTGRQFTVSVKQDGDKESRYFQNSSNGNMTFLYDEVPSFAQTSGNSGEVLIQVAAQPLSLKAGTAVITIAAPNSASSNNLRFDFVVLEKSKADGSVPAIFEQILKYQDMAHANAAEKDTYLNKIKTTLVDYYTGNKPIDDCTLRTEIAGDSQMLLTWDVNSSLKNQNNLKFRMKLNGQPVEDISGTSRKYVFTGLEAEKDYEFTVEAIVDDKSVGSASTNGSIRVLGSPVIKNRDTNQVLNTGENVRKLSFSIDNMSSSAKTIRLTVVRYHDNAAAEINDIPLTLLPGTNEQNIILNGEAIYKLPSEKLADTDCVKVFIWNGLEGYIPFN